MVVSLSPIEVLRLALASSCFYGLQGHECAAVLWMLCLWQTVLMRVLGELGSKTCVGRRWIGAKVLKTLDILEGLVYIIWIWIGHSEDCGKPVASGVYVGLALLVLLKIYSLT